MWKLIEISQQSYFIHCEFTSSQEVTFILYDLKETWCKSLPFHEIKQNVKLLNKRYDFNEANIRETLLNGEVHTASIEQQPHTSSTKQESCVVKLKYLVKNCPFHLEWSLRRQTLEEFQATFMQPLFTALQGCFQQVEILTEVLRKKDAELIQYRKEGAVLHRKTLATKPFDFNDFSQKYKVTTELAENYAELAKFVIDTKAKVGENLNIQPAIKCNEATKDEILLEENTVSTKNTNTKMSPKQRKRKVQEMKQQQLERQLKVRKEQFEYESSLSQTTNSSNSQSNDETLKTEQKDLQDDDKTDKVHELKQQKLERQPKNRKQQMEYESSLSPTTHSSASQSNDEALKIAEQKDLKDELKTTPKKKSESESGKKSTPSRRTRRCAPIRNYEENKSSDDKTDSDDDESKTMTPRQRKSTRNLKTGDIEKSASSNKCKEAVDNTKWSAADTCDKSSIKSPTLSYNTMKKSPGKSTPSLNNVYDFSTDSEHEKTTKTRSKLLKTSLTMTESRKNRTSPHILSETAVEQQNKSPSSNNSVVNRSKNLSHSFITQGADDISSQLNAIKKELKSLEALRLADLQQRMCKA